MKPTRRQFITAGITGLGALLSQGISWDRLEAGLSVSERNALEMEASPHVGSLYPLIQSQANRAHQSLSFLSGRYRDLEAWKRAARRRLQELLLYRPDPVAPSGEVLEKKDMGDYIRERVRFNTAPDVRVPAFVLVPKSGKPPYPSIVALHDHGGMYRWGKDKICEIEEEHPVLTAFRKEAYSGRSYAADLARLGFLVGVIDAFYFGERRLLLGNDAPKEEKEEDIAVFNRRSGQYEELMARTLLTAGLTWPGVMFWDDIRTVDYLLTRPDVDRKRIGCIGLSMGGFRSAHLTALDRRIRAAVVVGWMSSYPPMLRNHIINHTWMIYVPGLLKDLDLPDIVSLTAPNPLLIIHGSRDTLFPPEGVEAAFEKIRSIYRKIGAPDRFRSTVYDRPHEFNSQMQQEAFEWLQRWLQ